MKCQGPPAHIPGWPCAHLLSWVVQPQPRKVLCFKRNLWLLGTADEPGSCFQWVGVDFHKGLHSPKPTLSVWFCHLTSLNCCWTCPAAWAGSGNPSLMVFSSPALQFTFASFILLYKRSNKICARCATFLYILRNKGQNHFLFSLVRCLLFIHC